MINEIKKGFYFALGIFLFFILVFGIAFAIGFHSSEEILPGTFLGNYKFTGNVEYNGTLNATHAKLVGNFGNGIGKSNTSICNASNEGEIRFNPHSKGFEGCSEDTWKQVQAIKPPFTECRTKIEHHQHEDGPFANEVTLSYRIADGGSYDFWILEVPELGIDSGNRCAWYNKGTQTHPSGPTDYAYPLAMLVECR